MKIAESTIQLASSRTAVDYHERQELLAVWRQGKEPVRTDRKNAKDETLKHQADKLAKEAAKVSLSEAAKQKSGGYFADWVMETTPDYLARDTTEDVIIATPLVAAPDDLRCLSVDDQVLVSDWERSLKYSWRARIGVVQTN